MASLQHLTDNGLADLLNDCSIDSIIAIDNDWRIVAWNRKAEAMSGFSKKEVMGKSLLQVFSLHEQDAEMMTAIQLAFSGVKSFVPAHKELFNRQYVEHHFIPLRDADMQLIGVMNIMHDVAHRLKAEQQLYELNIALKKKYEQLERAADELNAITHIATHNIKEPLRQVYSSLELLIKAEARVLSDGGKANVRRMQSSLNRVNLLLDDIVALTGIHTPADEGAVVDLQQVFADAKEKLGEKVLAANAQLGATFLPVIKGHSELLHYLFYYLIQNALRFRQHEGMLKVEVFASEVLCPSNDPYDANERRFLKISFVDNGTGFRQEDAERMFLLTDKTPQKYATSGASLAICRKIMQAHDGFIQAEGWPGKGAAFHCYFPADKKE